VNIEKIAKKWGLIPQYQFLGTKRNTFIPVIKNYIKYLNPGWMGTLEKNLGINNLTYLTLPDLTYLNLSKPYQTLTVFRKSMMK
jgi:hypothetical protein